MPNDSGQKRIERLSGNSHISLELILMMLRSDFGVRLRQGGPTHVPCLPWGYFLSHMFKACIGVTWGENTRSNLGQME